MRRMESWLLVTLGALGTFVGLTLILPVTRRIWIFGAYVKKYFFLWAADRVGLRKLFCMIVRADYERLEAPVIARRLCEDLGPTFVKFGQIVASSSGLFPKRYTLEFQKVLDRVKPFAATKLEALLTKQFGEEYESLFEEFDPQPIAAASIAQVYGAVLKGGRKVVVKVQRPGIDRLIEADMRILRFVARIAEKHVKDADLVNPVGIVEDFEATLREELDFRKEAANMDEWNRIMRELGHEDIHAPRVIWDLTRRRVLTMERFYGTRIDRTQDIAASGVDMEERLVHGLRAWFQSVILFGFFHGDVHAGNLMLLDNRHIGFLDFGIVGRFDDRERWMVTDYVLAFAGADFEKLAHVMVDMGGVEQGVDMKAFVTDLEEAYRPMLQMSFGEIKYDELVPRIQKVASKHRTRLPKEFVLITKQMLYFDRYAKLLAPNLNVFTDPRLVFSLLGDIERARMQREEYFAQVRAGSQGGEPAAAVPAPATA
jgi:predicted unusual protein kinase regulating ubiquinone biosynthesis (AarF/ABC1/UbiB family)